jgi:hypothetical protein
MTEIVQYEIDVLRMMAGGSELPWGAAMSVVLGYLSGRGLCTRGPNYQITDKGREVLAAHPLPISREGNDAN